MALLSEILRTARQEVNGTEVQETGAVVISPTAAGQPTTISNNAGTAGITLNDNLQIQFGSGQNITSVTNTINDVDPNNDLLLANVTAIVDRINTAVSGALAFVKIDSKAAFDTFLAQSVIDPSSVLVTDATPFNYTDTNGVVSTNITYWQGIVTKPTASDALSSNTLATSNSANTMTGAEIAAALFAEPDTNNLTDARATVTDTIEATVTTGLASKVDAVPDLGLSQNNLTDALLDKINNTPSDTVTELAAKLDITSNIDSSINRVSNSGGRLTFTNDTSAANTQRYRFFPRNNATFTLEFLDDTDTILSSIVFNHSGTVNFPSTITQSGNNVVDVTNTTFSNLPADTTTALAGKVDVDGDKVLSDNNFTDAEQTKLAGLSNFTGGTLTSNLQLDNDNRNALEFNAQNNNSGFAGIAWSNNGGNYTHNIHRIPDTDNFGALQISVGSDTDITNLLYSVILKRDRTVDFFGNVTVENDIITNSNLSVSGNASITGDTTTANVTLGSGGDLNLSNLSADADDRYGRISFNNGGSLTIQRLNDDQSVASTIFFNTSNDVSLPRHLIVSQDITANRDIFAGRNINIDDSINNTYQFIPDTTGITFKPETSNPSNGAPLFQIKNTGDSALFRVEQAGSVTTSNDEIRIGTNANGSGGAPVLSVENIGDLISSDTFYSTFPSLSDADIKLWFSRKSSVDFVGVGAGTLNLPEIVAANANANQVLAGSTIVITNYNDTSDITLSRFNTGQTFMIDNVGDLQTSATLFASSKIELKALDTRNYATIPTDWTWALRGL